MSSYFRTAALCDRSVATTAPIDVYNTEPHYDDDDGEMDRLEEEAEAAAKASDPSLLYLSDPTQRSRAILDTKKGAEARKKLLREANVLKVQERREAQTERRLREIDERHKALQQEAREKAAQKQREAEEVARREAIQAKSTSISTVQSVAKEDDSAEDTRTPFELLRMEERRRLQHYNTTGFATSNVTVPEYKRRAAAGGIVGMYNEATLDTMFDAQGQARTNLGVDATLFPSEVQNTTDGQRSYQPRSGDATSTLIIPKDTSQLVSDGYGQEKAQSIIQRLNRDRERLKELHRATCEEVKAEQSRLSERNHQRDVERSSMLLEVVVQDNERKLRQHEASQLVKIQKAEEEALIRKREQHPIDTYHRAIREDVLGDRAATAEELEYRATMKRLLM